MKIREVLQKTYSKHKLSPLDAELLLSHVLKKPREFLFTHPECKLTKSQISRLKSQISRRRRGEPIAYLIGKKEFCGLDFFVNRDVLIPRPETETLVEAALRRIMNYDPKIKNVIDIGTGSGNIIVSLAKNIPAKVRNDMNFYATDISPEALKIARRNAKKLKVDKFITFIKSDLLGSNFAGKSMGNILIIANLPYVSPEIYEKSRENLEYEPRTALASKNLGLNHYHRLIGQIAALSLCRARPAACYVEISPEQKKALLESVRKKLPSAKIRFEKDLSGKIRVAKIDKI